MPTRESHQGQLNQAQSGLQLAKVNNDGAGQLSSGAMTWQSSHNTSSSRYQPYIDNPVRRIGHGL